MTTAKMQKMAPGLGIETGKSQNLLESMGVKAPRTTVNRDTDQDYKDAKGALTLAQKSLR